MPEMQPFESCFIRKVTMVKAVVMAILVGHYIVPSMESLRNVSKMDYLRARSTEIVLKEKISINTAFKLPRKFYRLKSSIFVEMN